MNNHRFCGLDVVKVGLFLAGFLFFKTMMAAAQEKPAPPVLRLPPTAKALVIDGKFSPGEWDSAFQGFGVIRHSAPNVLELRKARYWLTYDNERVYIAMQTELPPWGKLVGKRRRSPIDASMDDSIEFFVDPARAPGSPEESSYQLLGNFAGTMMNFIHNPKLGGSLPFRGDIQFENSLDGGWWTTEMSVRAEELGKAQLVNGQTWGFNFTRHWFNPTNYSAWPTIDYFGRTKYLKVTLDKAAPVVQLQNLGDPQGGKPGFDYSFFNPGANPLTLAVQMKVSDGAAKNVEEKRQITVLPGARERVAWQTNWSVGDKNLLESAVTSPDGQVRYFTMSMPFDRDNARQAAWEAPVQKTSDGTVSLAPLLYPGVSKLRCPINFSALPVPGVVEKAVVTVKDANDREIARGASTQFEAGEGEIVVDLPRPLPEGRYTAALTLLAGGKQVGDTVQKTFDKKNFPFEGNTIGISNKVLFPWTSMKVDGAKKVVSCWNRDHTISADGLFGQVKTGRYDLLKRPVYLAASDGGKELPWRGSGVKFKKAANHEVDFSAATTNDKVKASIDCHSEYDGMFKYTVTLAPRGDGKVDKLDLVVPLKEEYAWLMHATSDGTRTNASIFTPRGSGRVWDSTKVQQWRLTGTFIPYVWLGDDRAGLCWWADSEKGWVRPTDKNAPQMEVRRENGEVQMVFHIIARPFQLKEPRTVVFAFTATPVKPRPSWARSWTNLSQASQGYLKGPHLLTYGSAAWATFGSEKVPEHPYTYARIRPVNDEADKWLKDYTSKLHADKRTLVVYTDIFVRCRDRDDEVRYYASEWDRFNNPHPQEETQKWGSDGGPGHTAMTPSRLDYDLWCLNHDAELGVDGFYFDEVMGVGQNNPVAGLGFLAEDGQWEAESSLFALRTYFKRLYTMLQEMGRQEPFIMPHDTSTVYAGPMAFATIPMELEMVSSDPDPNRGQIFGIGESYAMADVMAFQYGLVGSGMYCAVGHQADAAQSRNFLGSMLLFDARAQFGPQREQGWEFDRQIGMFGIDQPGVQYVPYWRADDLQTIANERVYASLYRNGDRVLLAMYNDNPKPVTAEWKPTAKFGFKGNPVLLDQLDPKDKSKGQLPDIGNTLQIELGAYDYRLVQVSTNGTWGDPDAWGPVSPGLFKRNVTDAK